MEKIHFLWLMRKSVFFPFFPTFFDQIKNVKTEKFWSPQMIKVCQKKFPLFKIKNDFLAIFVIFWPKNAKNVIFQEKFLF